MATFDVINLVLIMTGLVKAFPEGFPERSSKKQQLPLFIQAPLKKYSSKQQVHDA